MERELAGRRLFLQVRSFMQIGVDGELTEFAANFFGMQMSNQRNILRSDVQR
jgi:hypothetical protein